MATVAEVMNRNVLAVDPTASIGEAAEKMMDAGVGAVVVMEDMVRLVGIVTERGGWLEVVCGPMFSGKSEELIRRLRRAEIAGQRALIVKPRLDNRYDIAHVVSHAGARMRAVAVDSPADIPGLVDGYDVVGVDEVQFFAPEIVLVLDGLVECGMRIVACGLDQDFRGFPFGTMPELLCRAELVDKLQAVCHGCGGPATMTQRLVDGAPASADGDTIVVGALEQYEARCRAGHQLAAPALAAS